MSTKLGVTENFVSSLYLLNYLFNNKEEFASRTPYFAYVRRTQRDPCSPVPLMCFGDGVPFLRCLGFTFQRLVFVLLSCFQLRACDFQNDG